MSTNVRVPPPLTVSASLVAVEAVVLIALGVAELASLNDTRVAMGLSTAAFFLGAAAGLLACAYALWRRRRWGRGPVLMAQLVALGLAWNFRPAETALIAVALLVVALVVIAGLVHRDSVAALEGDDVEEGSVGLE